MLEPLLPQLHLCHARAVCSQHSGLSGRRAFAAGALAGADLQTHTPLQRWDVERLHSAWGNPGTIATRFAAHVEGAEAFDAAAFKLASGEAALLDPHARLLLEHAQVHAVRDVALRFSKPLRRRCRRSSLLRHVPWWCRRFWRPAGSRHPQAGWLARLWAVCGRLTTWTPCPPWCACCYVTHCIANMVAMHSVIAHRTGALRHGSEARSCAAWVGCMCPLMSDTRRACRTQRQRQARATRRPS